MVYFVAALIALAVGGDRFTTHGPASPASSTATRCPAGVPRDKCPPAAFAPLSTPVASSSTPPSGVRSTVTNAGPSFVTTTQLAQIEDEYGLTNIFLDGGTWVIRADGESMTSTATPPAMAPGGPLVAVQACRTSSRCLDPNAPHDLSQFTVLPVPDPNAPLTLLMAAAGRVYFSDPVHGQIFLDLSSLQWREDAGSDRTIWVARPSLGISLP